MTTAGHGPRVLLRRLREVMAEQEPAQAKLERIVKLIAVNMAAEVCSVYVRSGPRELELVATRGLKREAVGQARLAVGEGLVGTIARTAEPLNLSDAQAHPAFRYLPETGEEPHASFLGVPILRGGEVRGVLVVQNRQPRRYSEEEEEALATVAMVLAEFLAAPEVERLHARRGVLRRCPARFSGTVLHRGLTIGTAVLHEPRIVVRNLVALDVAAEMRRLREAVARLREELAGLRRHAGRLIAQRAPLEIIEALGMFAHDRGWVRRMEEHVRLGLSAEAAVERVQADNRARMLRQRDPYLRARMHDLNDVAWRLLRILTGQTGTAADSGTLPRDAVLVARDMGAAELLDYQRHHLSGLVLEEGTRHAHVVLLARALDIPVVAQVEGITDVVETGDGIIVDARGGEVHVRPDEELRRAYATRIDQLRARRRAYAALRDLAARTRDGVRVRLLLNAGLPLEVEQLAETGAEGVGLYRTEMYFLTQRQLPTRAMQEAHYRQVLELAGARPVVFRTLDIGGDKTAAFLPERREANPALGWRALRLGLERPALLKAQLRALLKAAAGRELRVMFPLVADVEELRQARALLEAQRLFLKRLGVARAERVRVGAIVEVPALLWQLDALLAEVDFLAVGTNDLKQYLFAADRGDPRLDGRYDSLHPAMLRALARLSETTRGRGMVATVCGGMASSPLEAMVLVGLGFEALSMPAADIGPVKTMLRSLDVAKLREHVDAWLEQGHARCSLREEAARFAAANGVMLTI